METAGLIAYLMVFVFGFVVFHVFADYMEKCKEKKKAKEFRRLKSKWFETIDYTGFNPKTGKYEN